MKMNGMVSSELSEGDKRVNTNLSVIMINSMINAMIEVNTECSEITWEGRCCWLGRMHRIDLS